MTTESAIDLEHPCPYVGTGFDRTVHFGYPTHENVCFAAGRAAGIEIGHQGVYCLTKQHAQCPRYLQGVASNTRAAALTEAAAPDARMPVGRLRYALLGIGVVLLAFILVWLWPQIRSLVAPPVVVTALRASATPTPTESQAAEPTATPFVLQAVAGTPALTPVNTPTTLPPTSTATATTRPSSTPTASATATIAPTATPRPANTPTARPTNTPLRPTATRQPTAAPTTVDTAPVLRAPANNTVASGFVTFSWDWAGAPLAANLGFEVRVWRADQPDHYGAAAPVVVNNATIDLAGAYGVQQGGNGRYFWTVAVVELNPYRRIGPEATPRQLTIELPGGGPTPAPTLPP